MHCPKCGQQQISEEIRFCSKCGFSMAGVSALIAANGEFSAIQSRKNKDSPKKRGVKQGAFIFLLNFLVLPILGMFHILTRTEPILVALAAILLTFGGLLRVAYALLFESSEPISSATEAGKVFRPQPYLDHLKQKVGLPAGEPEPASVYSQPHTGKWRDTNELGVPMSVTDSTTKLLSKEKEAVQ